MTVYADTEELEKRHSNAGLFLRKWNVIQRAVMLLALLPLSSAAAALPTIPAAGIRNSYPSPVQRVHLIGEDDRWTEDEFSEKEHIAAQVVSGLMAVGENFSGIVPMECFWTDTDGS